MVHSPNLSCVERRRWTSSDARRTSRSTNVARRRAAGTHSWRYSRGDNLQQCESMCVFRENDSLLLGATGHVTDTARIVCGAWSMKLSRVRLSARPPVCSIDRPWQRCAAGLLSSARPAGDACSRRRHWEAAVPLRGTQQQMRAVSCWQRT